jgi:hypothetical protein
MIENLLFINSDVLSHSLDLRMLHHVIFKDKNNNEEGKVTLFIRGKR